MAGDHLEEEVNRKMAAVILRQNIRRLADRKQTDVSSFIATLRPDGSETASQEFKISASQLFALAKHFDVPVSRFFEDEAGKVVTP
ncbi:MAG: hypothetical protein ACTHLA_13415 [Asticcacaulis sp.]|uniref:hypothetical protein n=1 Tax=Asticcacaulis sp. TaxID=1872648 RepID=UPI003F7C5A6E